MHEVAEQIAKLSPEQRALLKKRLTKKQAVERQAIARRKNPEEFPLSFAQERLWMLHQFETGSLYNDYTAFRLRGKLDISALEEAFTEVLRRHEVLRATFPKLDDRLAQVIAPAPSRVTIPLIERPAASEAEIVSFAREEARTPFDLSTGPLIRALLLRVNEDSYVLLLTMHHIVTDGWSMGVLIREIGLLYEAALAGQPSPLAELPIQYADFAAWQREWLTDERLERQLAYWRRRLEGATMFLELPTDRPYPAIQTFNGARYYFELPATLTGELRALSQQEGVTLFMTLLAAFNVLLSRLSGQKDISIGTPVSGRNFAEVEGLIGLFINTLVLRTDVSGNPTFRKLLARTREQTLGDFAHQDLPFEKLVAALEVERTLSHTPLFQVMFSFQVPSATAASGFPGIQLGSLDADNQMSPFNLIAQLNEGPEMIYGRFQYNTDLFDAATIKTMVERYQRLLEGIVRQPESRILDLPLITEEERREIIHDFNPRSLLSPSTLCLHHLFEEQVARSPLAIALSGEAETLTYAELNRRAEALARTLVGHGLAPDERVGVLMERSPALVVTLLGVLKAGGAYLPLDEQYPSERLRFMIEDGGARLIVTQAGMAGWLGQVEAVVVDYEEAISAAGREGEAAAAAAAAAAAVSGERGRGESGREMGQRVCADNAAYVIYTSGSTGQPKGVVVTHANLTRLFHVTAPLFAFDSTDVWTMFHSPAFDFSVWEMWGALLYGGRLVVVPRETSRTPEAFQELLRRERVTVLNQTPSAFRQLMSVDEEQGGAGLEALRVLIFGGEALEASSLRGWVERHGDEEPQLVNMYGITETTVHVTYSRVRREEVEQQGHGSWIGRALGDLRVYVLDERMKVVPVGVKGEIYVGGGGVARGYLNRGDLSGERFVPDGESGMEGERMYRSGDVGRWVRGGELEYLGRVDEQVKVRGYRIELGEIEATLVRHPAVLEARVIIKEYGPDDKRLAAFIVPSQQRAFAVRQMLQLEKRGLPSDAQRYELPNRLTIFHQNQSETDFVYHEIFTEQTYLKHGITVRDGDCVFDVGANIGLFTLFIGQRHKNATLYAVEPLPPIFKLLQLNAALYGLKAHLFECGLSNESKQDTFTFYPHASVISGRVADSGESREVVKSFLLEQQNRADAKERISESLVEELLDERLQTQQFVCQLRTLSQLMRENDIERIDLLKVDVEGSEQEVLDGIEESDWPKIRQLVVEVHDIDGRLTKIARDLRARGYEVAVEQDTLLQSTGLYNLYAKRLSDERGDTENVAAGELSESGLHWSNPDALIRDLQAFLKGLLPEHMIPSAFALLDEIPLTSNGKLDERALPQINQSWQKLAREYVAPRNQAEQTLADIWAAVLNVDGVGINDNFFELGGHSLLATQTISRVRQEFGIDLPMKSIFEGPSIAQLSTVVEKALSELKKEDIRQETATSNDPQRSCAQAFETPPVIRKRQTSTPVPLSLSQERIWFLDHVDPYSAVHNAPSVLRLDGDLRINALEQALTELVRRHEALRTAFRVIDGQPMQVVLPPRRITLSVIDLDEVSDSEREAEVVSLAGEEARVTFDLSQGELLRATLLRWGKDSHVLFLTTHHLVFDGWSKGVMIRELLALYKAFSQSRPSPLPELPIQYADFTIWQREWLTGKTLERHLDYWRERLKDASTLNLPTDHPRPASPSFRGARKWVTFPADLTDALQAQSSREDVSLFMVLLAAFYVLLHKCTKQEDLIVGTHVANRTRMEVEGLIGFFVNTLAVRADLSGDPTFLELLTRVREALLGAYQYQEVPFDKVIKALDVKPDKSRMPIFQVLFALHNAPRPPIELPGLTQSMVRFDDRLIRYDLEFDLWRAQNGLEGFMVYSTDLFEETTADRMVAQYEMILRAIVAAPERSLSELLRVVS